MKLTIKPRTQLALDLALFVILTLSLTATFIEHAIAAEGSHAYEMMHILHGITGGLMALMVLFHLILHYRWIIAQLKMELKRHQSSSRPARS